MRLTTREQSLISSSVKQRVHCPYKLYLYGSRIDDTQKGGDIDLLLLLDNNADRPSIEKIKHQILASIKSQIGEQKIDLTIFSKSQLGHEPFLDLIFSGAISLSS